MLEQLSRGLSIAAQISPQPLSNATLTSGNGINMKLFRRILAVIQVGAGAGSITAVLRSSASSGGTFADISSTTITAITTTNKQATIERRDDQMLAGQPWLRLEVTEGNVACTQVSAVLLGGETQQKPANANDLSTVAQRLVK
jgi:hypothetical protein